MELVSTTYPVLSLLMWVRRYYGDQVL